ncbi:MAG: VanZ family protein [Betaproteobacteria bacterium]|jgi:VanZ family protein
MTKIIEPPPKSAVRGNTYPLARLSATGLFLLIAFVSLTPFDIDTKDSAQLLDWITAPIPRYIPLFDVVMNILGYIPLGFILVFAAYPRYRKWQALLFSLLVSVLFSGILESAQTYLMTRISSSVDWYANILGALIGGLFALPLSPALLSGNVAERVRHSIFGGQQRFFLLFLLFPWAQIYPQNAWMGMGDLGLKVTRISPYWSLPIKNFSQEIFATFLATIIVGTVFLYATQVKKVQIQILSLLFVATIGIKIFISYFQLGLFEAMNVISVSSYLGLLLGVVILLSVRKLTKETQRLIAIYGLILLVIVVNIMPLNPFFLSHHQMLPQGRITHFNVLFQWLSWIWPIWAILCLMQKQTDISNH